VSIALVLACLVLAAPAGAQEGYSKTSYVVPVTQPDELGDPVTIDTDVYLPTTPPPPAGHPLVMVFHGGGSNKDSGYDAAYAAFFARNGYAAVLYSQRGHGNSTGQTAVAGPKEMRDLFDVAAWALGRGGRTDPAHPDFRIDSTRIALQGYSQGGLHTNLGQVWHGDPALNPYGIFFRALLPGNTPDRVFKALIDEQVVKMTFGVGLLGTYTVLGSTGGRVAPAVHRWIATAAADQPELYGGGLLCDATGHDTETSTMRQDLAARSVGCFTARMRTPSMWAQAFDDELFTPDMAIRMWREMPSGARNRLYLDMAGHAAPAGDPEVLRDKRRLQLMFLDHHLRDRRPEPPLVVYWTRDPKVRVPGQPYAYPPDAWERQTSKTWPPAGIVERHYGLTADGRALRDRTGPAGTLALTPLAQNSANDPVAQAATSSSPLGTSPVPGSVPSTTLPGSIAGFVTDPFATAQELSGATSARLTWTPASPDTQLVLQVYDQAPDGTLTLLSRGVKGLRRATPGTPLRVRVTGTTFSARIRPGHRVLAWVMAGNFPFYKPYAGSLGGALQVGKGATLTLPLRPYPG